MTLDDTDVGDEIADVCADLVSHRRYEALVLELFSSPPGTWRGVVDLCSPDAEDLCRALPADAADLRVCWIEYEVGTYGLGYCLIVFYAEDLGWHTVALYNKARVGQTR